MWLRAKKAGAGPAPKGPGTACARPCSGAAGKRVSDASGCEQRERTLPEEDFRRTRPEGQGRSRPAPRSARLPRPVRLRGPKRLALLLVALAGTAPLLAAAGRVLLRPAARVPGAALV